MRDPVEWKPLPDLVVSQDKGEFVRCAREIDSLITQRDSCCNLSRQEHGTNRQFVIMLEAMGAPESGIGVAHGTTLYNP